MEQDHGEAQFWLGVAYQYGRGVKRSQREAMAWITRAAKNNVPLAEQYLLQMRSQFGD